MKSHHKTNLKKDVIHTACGGCYAGCAVKVHRINGKPFKIEGFEGSSLGADGGVCGKGASQLMLLYDPNRINVPLRRTNPEKGVGVDPMWKEITWDEALDEIAERLKKIRADDPNKLMFGACSSHGYGLTDFQVRWTMLYGSMNLFVGGSGVHCGNGAHHVAGLVHGSWSVCPDWKLCNYVISFGASKGTAAGHSMAANARLGAEFRSRGGKLVVFDPMCNFLGGKASEWIPILPGTDSIVALAMANIIVNEIGQFDAPFIKAKTNLPFLTGPDGKWIRDDETEKPFLWNEKESRPVLFDEPNMAIDDIALTGEFDVQGLPCQPAFNLLKEHLKQYTAEDAAKESTVPAETIYRLSGEWVENAKIGSTITIEGEKFPYRPVAAIVFRGGQGHTNGLHATGTIDLLNQLVGAEDVPGGCLGYPGIKLGHPDIRHNDLVPRVGKDGALIPGTWFAMGEPWPPEPPVDKSLRPMCNDVWTMVTVPGVYNFTDREDVYQATGMDVKPEMAISCANNWIATLANAEEQVKLYKGLFTVVFDLYSSESAEAVADILLPDQSWLERFDWYVNLVSHFFNHPPTWEDWDYHPQIPVVDEPVGERRFYCDVMLELAGRIGFKDMIHEIYNMAFKIDDPAYQLKPDEELTWTEMGDKILKWYFGPKIGVDYIKKEGSIKYPKKKEEVYWRWNWEGIENIRSPVYMEYLVDIGKKMKAIGKKGNLAMEYEQFTPLLSYFTPVSKKEMTAEYDLLAFSYRDILHTNTQTQENPFLDEISQLTPYTYTITMNADTAKEKGLESGDTIWLETPYQKKQKGILKVLQGQHPQTVAIAGHGGLWARGRPVAKGKGVHFCWLLESDLKHYDPISLNIETSVPVKVYKAEKM